MDLNNWTKALAEKRWPILPDTLAAMRDEIARHSDLINFTDLANLCLSDPFLLLDLYRVVGNSRALQRNEGIPSVEQTLMLMGLEAVVNRFNRVEGLEPEEGKLDAEVYEAVGDWLGRSRVAAFIVKEWLSIMGDLKVEDCFVAALLYNMPGCLYMIQRNQLPDRPLLQEVSEAFNVDYAQVLESFIKHMPLPGGFQGLIGPGAPNKRKQLLKLALATANSLEHGVQRSTWLVGVDTAAKLINSTPEMAYMAVVHAALNVAKHPHVPGYTYPARALLMLPSEGRKAEMRKAAALSGADQLEAAIKESIRFLANDLKFERVLYYHYEHDGHALKLRYQVGVAADSPLRKLEVELEPGSFFGVFASKPQSFHAPKEVRGQLSRRYGDAFFQQVGEHEFALMTLFGGHTLSGVFYVDNAVSGREIDDQTYHRFKEMITRLAMMPR
ncbi:HDOD domain-containing protein [Chromobacterium sp. IIBBL 290-4]|uniref:HDOD domain-containing protein n=1 Tax=Chromobacterium sp. IIBBL 290-4 TaxID=2953890 RepID=UPI0020B640BF|nr:HDOD domain-containing protein [Chromobacterium sp. IIBBL 290-4]UTH73867.1 HDOD domain-containing protein [Chromobacterium sp. IIBBL 290-4]